VNPALPTGADAAATNGKKQGFAAHLCRLARDADHISAGTRGAAQL